MAAKRYNEYFALNFVYGRDAAGEALVVPALLPADDEDWAREFRLSSVYGPTYRLGGGVTADPFAPLAVFETAETEKLRAHEAPFIVLRAPLRRDKYANIGTFVQICFAARLPGGACGPEVPRPLCGAFSVADAPPDAAGDVLCRVTEGPLVARAAAAPAAPALDTQALLRGSTYLVRGPGAVR